ncbi:FecCD family ABC transporter permease [Aureispira anguillae]|uniref:Iron ABC transporter permease n=1 Tax=Aureispira anguillae TaxID=2864201 RepID=A0A915YDZ0_9BACT|nr:iron ABC transporter permease [Aureispira anguillae]BDS11268.1 iron ABC transporter permease [Aureispira anguillae]
MSTTLKIGFLFFVLLLFFWLNLIWGSVEIPLHRILDVLLGNSSQKSDVTIVWDFRMPKILAALISGASLGVSGLLMQTFFRNPIAGPFVLGISSGASLGVALFILATGWLSSFALFANLGTSNWMLIIMAMLGAGLVLFLLMLVSWRISDINTLLILGLMFGSATSAIVSLLQYFSSQQALQQFVLWSMGSLTGVTWEELKLLLPICMAVLGLTFGLTKSLDALLLGEQYALSMGVHVRQAQQKIILVTAILAGGITAFCGPIAFVGIAVPHLARMLFQTHQHLTLLIGTILLGMITLLFCQFIAQLPGSDQMLPINVVTSFLGAPMVIYIVLSKQTV